MSTPTKTPLLKSRAFWLLAFFLPLLVLIVALGLRG